MTAPDPPRAETSPAGTGRTREDRRGPTYFQRVRWRHDPPDQPVVLWAEVSDGWEVRKVDEFADGRLVRADAESESDGTVLGDLPVPAPDEIARDPQFVVEVVDRARFEAVWQRAWTGGDEDRGPGGR